MQLEEVEDLVVLLLELLNLQILEMVDLELEVKEDQVDLAVMEDQGSLLLEHQDQHHYL
jgi:hypothetical protein